MLPIVITGQSDDRIHSIGRSFPMAQCVPLRSVKFDPSLDYQSIPALAAPSIVLLDVESRQAEQMCLYIKRFKMTYPNSAILVMIGFGDTDMEQQAIEWGADDVLTRPASVGRMSLTLKNLSELVSQRLHVPVPHARGSVLAHSTQDHVCMLDEQGALRRLHHMEQDVIEFAVKYCHGHISNAAKALGIGRSTLYRKLDAIETRKRFQHRMGQTASVPAAQTPVAL